MSHHAFLFIGLWCLCEAFGSRGLGLMPFVCQKAYSAILDARIAYCEEKIRKLERKLALRRSIPFGEY